MSSSTNSVALGAYAAAAASFLAWRRLRPRSRGTGAAVSNFHASPDEPCAVCLEAPTFPCETPCGHRFCTDCFLQWSQRQPGTLGGPSLESTRCPLCAANVERLEAVEPWPDDDDGAAARALSLRRYNMAALVSGPVQRAQAAVAHLRRGAAGASLLLYGLNGVLYQEVATALRLLGQTLPLLHDAKRRTLVAYIALSHLIAGPRGPAWVEVVDTVADWARCFDTWWFDRRHSMLAMPVGEVVSRAALLHSVATFRNLTFLSGPVTRFLFSRLPASHQHRLHGHVRIYLRVQAAATGIADVVAIVLNLQLELAGLHGLLLLVLACTTAPQPDWLLPYVGLDGRERTFVSYRDGRERISWPAALVRFGPSLRALRVFFSPAELARPPFNFPEWAIEGMRRLPPLTAMRAAPRA